MYFDEGNFELRTLGRHIGQCSDIEKANSILKTV